MKLAFTWVALVLVLLIFAAGCAPGTNPFKGTPGDHAGTAGFWLGVWQGFIAPFVFVASLFRPHLNIYEVHNNGTWYNLGYLFGVACFFGGGGHRAGAARPGKLPARA